MTASALPPIDFSRLAPPPGFRLVVTGGCGGIGRRLVESAAAQGLTVAVLDLKAALKRYPVPKGVAAIDYDARDDAATKRAFAKVAKLWGGAVDGFVHLPGYMTPQKNFDSLAAGEFDEGMSVNLRSAYLCMREVLPMIRKAGGGSVIFAASGLATLVEKGTATYSAAKAGLIALAKGLAKENAPAIRFNCIAPAAVDTAFLAGGTSRGGDAPAGAGKPDNVIAADHMARITATIPMGRIGVVDDVVGPTLFLLGQASRFMTGQTLYINGGRLMV